MITKCKKCGCDALIKNGEWYECPKCGAMMFDVSDFIGEKSPTKMLQMLDEENVTIKEQSQQPDAANIIFKENDDAKSIADSKKPKKEKNKNESRIRYLERMLKTASVISDESKMDEVGLNNRVTVYFEDDDEEEVYKLVTSVRGNSLKNYISIESPIGKAIRGAKVGDRVYVKVNENAGYYLEIRAIEKSDDEAEDSIRKY